MNNAICEGVKQVRKTFVELLVSASELLPVGYRCRSYSGNAENLFDDYYKKLKVQFSKLCDNELFAKTSKFVSNSLGYGCKIDDCCIM